MGENNNNNNNDIVSNNDNDQQQQEQEQEQEQEQQEQEQQKNDSNSLTQAKYGFRQRQDINYKEWLNEWIHDSFSFLLLRFFSITYALVAELFLKRYKISEGKR